MQYDGGFFDDVYAERDGDPWGYWESDYEREKCERTLAALRTRLAPEEPAEILDLGCGNGAKTARLVEAYPDTDVLGVDVSERALAKAREQAPGAEYRQADLTDFLAETDRTFDAVIDVECLAYLLGDRSVTAVLDVAADLADVLEPEGPFVSTHVHMPTDVGPAIGQERAAQTLRTILETAFERVGRERYDGHKTVALDEDEPESQPYEVWTFQHESARAE